VTESTASAAAGWYDDPAGTGQKRWWDGVQWSEHLHDPSLEVYGVVAKPVVGAGTPVYNAFIWVITLLPLVSIAAVLPFDMTGYMLRSVARVTAFDGSYVLLTLLGWAIYLVTPLLAYYDWKKLRRDGYERPFHWAWSFLTSAVYIIGRSVIAKRRSGRGLLPIWIWIAVTVLSIVVSFVKIAGAMSAVYATMPSFS
jgi:hypothetical protein